MHQDFEILRNELEQVLDGLNTSQTQLRTHGDADRWTIQQTVSHLLLSYAATERVFEARLEKGRGTRAKPSLTQRLAQAVIVRGGIFPPGRTAPAMVWPTPDEAGVPGKALSERIDAALRSLDGRMAAGECLLGTQCQGISHVMLGPMSVPQWRRFQLVHGRHHMKFLGKIRKEFGV